MQNDVNENKLKKTCGLDVRQKHSLTWFFPSVSTYTSGHLFMKFCSWNLHEMWNPSCPAAGEHIIYRPSWAELQQHSWPGQQWLWLGGADRAAAAVWVLTSSLLRLTAPLLQRPRDPGSPPCAFSGAFIQHETAKRREVERNVALTAWWLLLLIF